MAAGRSQRFGGAVPKPYAQLAGESVLRRTIRQFGAVTRVNAIRVVISPEHRALYDEATAGLDLGPPIEGGTTRQDSVRRGLEALAPAPPGLVAIHDAARPWVRPAEIETCLAKLDDIALDGAVLGARVVDTLKRVSTDDSIAATVPRQALWRAFTPQVFRFAPILAAHRAAAGRADAEATAFTDDAAVAEAAGLRVAMVPGDDGNRKITESGDLGESDMETRTGFGFDVHAFGSGSGVTLCGVAIPHDRALVGHSDADVALHAATDAVLGALAAGDIGQHFPPSDPQWRVAASARFLAHALDLMRARGGRLVHLDITLVCETPRVGPHRSAMVQSVAGIAGVDASRISVKATTTERLGFTGRGEGIAAQAIATLALPA